MAFSKEISESLMRLENLRIILVTGGRAYSDKNHIYKVLDSIRPIDLLVHGGATGADSLAGKWAEDREISCARNPAKWIMLGKSAGHFRNAWMLDKFEPNLVVAFPGRRGTTGCVEAAKKRGIEVIDAGYSDEIYE